MKTITVQQLDSVLENIVDDKQKQAGVVGVPFIGVTQDEMMSEVTKRLGRDWVLKKEQPFKLTKDDVNAIASSRFNRKSGMRLLMVLTILILSSAILTITFRVIPTNVYYAITAALAVLFVYFYSRGQRQTRIDLWKSIEGENLDKDK